ncbi:MAG: hypothetical protein N2749_04415 [Clostridia bacterium]|nr:hypothetical protein [Clostridia bacterium]
MKKLIIYVVALAVIVGGAVGVSNIGNTKLQTAEENAQNIVLDIGVSADFSIDFSDYAVLSQEATDVIIAKVSKIDGAINYNPVKKIYTHTFTIGDMEVLSVEKGNIEANTTVPFMKLGGTIAIEEYEKTLDPMQKEKLVSLAKYNEKEATKDSASKISKSTFVREKMENDIDIEEDKKYLMFLKYSRDYDRYSIIGFEYGLREFVIKTNQIKDNITGKFENSENIFRAFK